MQAIVCVLNISTHAQVTVAENDRAVQEKERVNRVNEQLIQTLLVCSYISDGRWLVGGAKRETHWSTDCGLIVY